MIAEWRYDPPYDTYAVGAEDAAAMGDPEQGCSSTYRDGELIGYVCIGTEARVEGPSATARRSGVVEVGRHTNDDRTYLLLERSRV